MRLLAILLCTFMAACASTGWVRDGAHQKTVRLDFAEGLCSGTIIGPRAILSATHCFTNTTKPAIWRQPIRILERMDDGNDHTIVIVDRTFDEWAVVNAKFHPGEPVFMFGNPGGLSDQFRAGYVAGMADTRGKLSDLFDLRIWKGDSGSGIFNARGELIAVVSFIDTLNDDDGQLTMAGSWPLAFTPAQWARASR